MKKKIFFQHQNKTTQRLVVIVDITTVKARAINENILNVHNYSIVTADTRRVKLKMSKRNSYKSLNFADKVAIIEEIEKKELSQIEIAKKWGISESTLSTFKRNKQQIFQGFARTSGGKRLREPEIPEVDRAVTMWFSEARNNKINLDGPLIRGKAEQLAKMLGQHDFKASKGWFANWKRRNDVVLKSEAGESGAVDERSAAEWMMSLDPILQEYSPKDTFNADEAALFFKCTPNRTFAFKGDPCFGGKKSKERVTILVGANMDGSEKLPLLLIGKSARPHCFRNCKSKPVEYRNNKKAWMTGVLFEEWLLNVDHHFRKKRRTILLFIDNCSAHNRVPNLKNIKVIFLPSNMTSVVQPMDMGIIKNLKTFYRQKLVVHILAAIEAKKELKVDLLLASRILKESWNKVQPETIQQCFKKAGFFCPVEPEVNIILETPEGWSKISDGIAFQDYVDVDDNLSPMGEKTDQEIVAEIQGKKVCVDSSSSEEDNAENDLDDVSNASEADECLNKLMRYVHAQENVSDQTFSVLQDLENFIFNSRVKNRVQKKSQNISSATLMFVNFTVL